VSGDYIKTRCEPAEHKYEPRHDEKVNELATANAVLFNGQQTPIVDRIYVADVCAKCGDYLPRGRTKS
jgi:hypothetical protein